MKWKYMRKKLSGYHEEITVELNTLGEDHWELVYYEPLPSQVLGYNAIENVFVVMKRDITPVFLND